jgi:5'(3')-deoxyribonucleotidase
VPNNEFVFGVDLDGVVADFYGGMGGIAAEWLNVPIESLTPNVSFGLPEWGVDKAPGGYDALHKFAVTQREFFRILNPVLGAPLALRRLSDHHIRIRIITHRLFIKYFHEVAIRQTVEWLDHHDIPYSDLCFMKDKAAVGADLYIEDAPDNVERLRRDKHDVVVFSNSTNVRIGGTRANTWEEVVPLVLKAEESWKAWGRVQTSVLVSV